MRKKAMDYRVNKMPWTKELIPEEFPEWRISSKTKPHFLCHGDKISLGDIEFTVLHTPGHSYGHIMLLNRNNVMCRINFIILCYF